ncbi:hypothetical protein FEDK69T_21310 [Flavobacterium enshiense DK69]|nr:hypothetical protein FEDK69T_21310 [Flavobacterium enshiense DK69]
MELINVFLPILILAVFILKKRGLLLNIVELDNSIPFDLYKTINKALFIFDNTKSNLASISV